MAALVFKVGTLFIKTASKPLANRFQAYVLNHEILRSQVIKLAQYLHRAEVAINRGAEGKVGKVFVGDITEERAVELASKFVSEGFLFMVGTGVIALELRRSDSKDREKKAKEAAFREQIDQEIREERQALSLETSQIRSVMAAIEQRQEQVQQQLDALQSQLENPASRKSWPW